MELSFSEMVVIALIAFVVLGPEDLAHKAAKLGKFVGKLRTEINNFKVLTQEELLSRADQKKVGPPKLESQETEVVSQSKIVRDPDLVLFLEKKGNSVDELIELSIAGMGKD